MCLMVQDSNNLDTEDVIIFTNLLARFDDLATAIALTHAIGPVTLKGTKREILSAMHVKELIQSNHSER